MARQWKPSKTQKREFAQRMANDAEFKKAYEERQEKNLVKKRSTSKFDYNTAGGTYVPTESQNRAAFELYNANSTPEEKEAANRVLLAYACKEKVHHDFIHIVNEYIRKK